MACVFLGRATADVMLETMANRVLATHLPPTWPMNTGFILKTAVAPPALQAG
jgi:hypothetical protein